MFTSEPGVEIRFFILTESFIKLFEPRSGNNKQYPFYIGEDF